MQDNSNLIEAVGRFWLTLRQYGKKMLAEANYDLTFEQVVALKIIEAEEGLRIKELAEKTERDSTTTSRMIDGLGKKNLVVRVPDPQDSRQRLIYLTRRAKERLVELDKFRQQFEDTVLNGVGREEAERVAELVRRMTANIEIA